MNYFERLISRTLAQTGVGAQHLFDPFEQTAAEIEWPESEPAPNTVPTKPLPEAERSEQTIIHERVWPDNESDTLQTKTLKVTELSVKDISPGSPSSVTPEPVPDKAASKVISPPLPAPEPQAKRYTTERPLQHADKFMQALGINTIVPPVDTANQTDSDPDKPQTSTAEAAPQVVQPPSPNLPRTRPEEITPSGRGRITAKPDAAVNNNNPVRDESVSSKTRNQQSTPVIETQVVIRSSRTSWVDDVQQSKSRGFGVGQL